MRKRKSNALHMSAVGTGAATAPAPIAIGGNSRRKLTAKPMGISVTSRTRTARAKVSRIDAKIDGKAKATPVTIQESAEAIRAAKAAAAERAKIELRDRVVLEHLPLVKAIAVRVHENLPVHVDMDDLVHAGILGLFDAASKYNPDKQVAFSSYAKHRIKGAILDSLRQLDWASRDMRRRHKQVEAATRELASELKRNPTEHEVATRLGIDQERWRSMMLDLRNVGLISASTRTNDSEDLPAPDFPGKPETQPDSICAREQLRSVLGVAMQTLPERYQKVVSLYYTREMTMKEIGTILGINESRVSQIHKAALEKMAVVLESNGISSSQAF
jgi:RNA polymerase sigma factor for flagellar operon FliA